MKMNFKRKNNCNSGSRQITFLSTGTGISPGGMTIAKLCRKGCGDAGKPAIAFTTNTTIYAGNILSFTNQSTVSSCDAAATSWQWAFTGGTPSSSTLQNPTGIVYNTAGTYRVKLVVTPCEKDSLIKNSYITVNVCGSITATINSAMICRGTVYAKGTAACADCGCKEWVMVTPQAGQNPTAISALMDIETNFVRVLIL
ncbi:MAG: PKD domain-containing protein [Bacteroidetes bacterium]|nr:PKD domain-containing protein [Bacteroidota bacterium]